MFIADFRKCVYEWLSPHDQLEWQHSATFFTVCHARSSDWNSNLKTASQCFLFVYELLLSCSPTLITSPLLPFLPWQVAVSLHHIVVLGLINNLIYAFKRVAFSLKLASSMTGKIFEWISYLIFLLGRRLYLLAVSVGRNLRKKLTQRLTHYW